MSIFNSQLKKNSNNFITTKQILQCQWFFRKALWHLNLFSPCKRNFTWNFGMGDRR
jgi:hypothetical protein